MDIATISAAYQGLTYAKSTLSALLKLKIDAESLAKVTEAVGRLDQAQATLFDAREQLFSLQTTNEELRQLLLAQERWESQLEQFEIAKTDGGAIVYRARQEPMRYACPSCIAKREIHLLQDSRNVAGHFVCPNCKFAYPVKPRVPPKPIHHPPSDFA